MENEQAATGPVRTLFHRRALALLTAPLLIASLVAIACGGGEDEERVESTEGRAAPSASPTPRRGTTPEECGDKIGDPDGDGVCQLGDNCPGIKNPDQEDTDSRISTDVELYEEGDACDDDIDGDGVENQDDEYPRDTDDDGADNPDDDDDEGDDIPDSEDNCVLVANRTQRDSDEDGGGDDCDADDDDDDFPDLLEQYFTGSDPLDPDSTPEFVENGDACADGRDNDLDGKVDQADELCVDSDSDSYPDSLDNCPHIDNRDQFDPDEDDLGAECDPDDDNDGISDESDECPDMAIDEPKDPNVDATGCNDEERRQLGTG